MAATSFDSSFPFPVLAFC